MIEPTDEDIAEALRLSDYWPFASAPIVRDFAKIGASQAVNCLAHARTIAKLRIAVEALEKISIREYDYAVSGAENYADAEEIADAALHQIKGQSNDQ